MKLVEMAHRILRAKNGDRVKFNDLATDLIQDLRSTGAHDWGRTVRKRFGDIDLQTFYEKATISVDMNGEVTWYFDGQRLGRDNLTLQEKMQRWTGNYLSVINTNREYQKLPKIPSLWLRGYIGDTKPENEEELVEE